MTRFLVRSFVTAAVLLLGVAATARAQRFEGSAGVERLSRTIRDASGSGSQSGVFLGVEGSVGLGALRLGIGGAFGQVTDPAKALPDRKIRTSTISLSLRPSRALEFGAEAHARRDDADSNVVLNRLAGVFGRFTTDLGIAGLEGTAELAYLPLTSSSVAAIGTGLRAGVGARFAPGGGPVMVELGYRFFRVDHQAVSGVARLEQDEALILALGFRSRVP